MDFFLHNPWLIFTVAALATALIINFQQRNSTKALEKKILAACSEKNYTRAVEIAAAHPSKSFSFPTALALARARGKLSDYPAALQAYHALTIHLPENDPLHVSLLAEEADLHFRAGDSRKAEQCYRIAFEKEPANGDLAFKYAEFFYKVGAHNRCLPLLESALEQKEGNLTARFLLAEALASLSFYEKALHHYEILTRYRRGVDSYHYIKTLKECGFPDRALPLYQNLVNSPSEPPYAGYDAPQWPKLWEKAVRDCVQIYLKKENGAAEGINFIERCLPKVSEDFSRELRARKAEMYASMGADFTALGILSDIYKEDRDFPDARLLVENWGKALYFPFLNDYYTSDAERFEKIIKNILSSNMVVLKKDQAYYYCALGPAAHVFYRRIRPVPPDVVQQLNWDFRSLAQALSTLHLYSLNGLTPNAAEALDKSYFFSLHQGTEFLKEVSAAITMDRGAVKFPSDLKYEDL